MRGLDQPGIPATEFDPAGALNAGSYCWGVAARAVDGTVVPIEVLDPADVIVNGLSPAWFAEDNGSGVLYGRAWHPLIGSVAVLRAVPLS